MTFRLSRARPPGLQVALPIALILAVSACTPSPGSATPTKGAPAGSDRAVALAPTPTEPSPPKPAASPSPPAPPTATARVRLRFGPGSVEIPILLYHHVATSGGSSRYTVSTEAFDEQMTYLAENGYHTVTIADVAEAIRNGADLPSNPIVLTFDDGNEDTFTVAWPRMQARDFTGVAYIVANRVGVEGFLSADQLKELAGAGWEIGSHSMTHTNLAEADHGQWRPEILGSKLELQRLLGVPVESFAYPFGVATPEILRKTAEYGYRSGVGLGKAVIHDRNTLYYLDRREVLGSWDLATFADSLRPPG
jgi:peptidoglycan/xylan/chitin deacetylase (PgdA/CDA1 family)